MSCREKAEQVPWEQTLCRAAVLEIVRDGDRELQDKVLEGGRDRVAMVVEGSVCRKPADASVSVPLIGAPM